MASARMANYQPSFGRTGVEIGIDRFDGATVERELAWDICNEPFNNGREIYVDWLRHTYGMAKTLGAQQPVGVSVAATQNDLQLVEPLWAGTMDGVVARDERSWSS